MESIVFLLISIFIYGYILCVAQRSMSNFSKCSTYRKESFVDWIFYVLAWIFIPFSIISSIVLFFVMGFLYPFQLSSKLPSKMRIFFEYKNWEEIRRWNLYVFTFFCFIFGLVYVLIESSDYVEKVALPFHFFVVIISWCICGCMWKLMEKYERHIENKLFIPNSDVPAAILKKRYKQQKAK